MLLRGALFSVLIFTAGCSSADSAPSAPYLGTFDPVIYVGQLTPPSQLVSTLDGRPLPSSLTLRIDSGDVSDFVVGGSSLKATQPAGVYLTVTDPASSHATTVHVGAVYDTRGKWVFRSECPWVGDSTHATWEIITVRSDSSVYPPTTKPGWINAVIAAAQTTALATTIDSTITVHYQGGAIVKVDTNAQTNPSAINVSSKSAPIRIDIPRPTYPFLEVGFPSASSPGGLSILPIESVTPLLAGDSGQTFCGGVSSSDPTLHRSTLTELRAVP
jgi:hypothetical protein